jgi:O-antigen ligase
MQLLEPRSMRLTFLTAFIVQAIAIGTMWLAPCWYGSATWQAQQVIFAIGIALAGFMAFHVAIAAALGEGTAMPNALSWTLFALGGLGLLQTQPIYTWDGSSIDSPPSIVMQRWALGMADPPAAITEGMISSETRRTEKPLQEHCVLKEVPEEMKRLSLSVEPMTTRGAAGSLFLAGLLVWIGSSLFSRRNLYPILLVATVVLGIVIALLGILNGLIPASRQWIGMSGNSYATFVSKNSAGAFLNVALAAACGFAIWAFHRAWKRKRHSSRREWQGAWEAGPFSVVREVLAKLDAIQIASILIVAWIATAVFVSLSRGAAVSAIAAGLATVIVILPGKHRSFAIFGALLVAALAVGLMVFFQLDEQVSTRLESLGEIDMENEAVGGRLYIWNVSWRAASFYGWLGSGLGTFHYSSLPFQRPSSTGWFYHAESIYCEALVTLGLLGALAILAAIVGCFRSLRSIYVSRRFSDFAPMLTAGMFLLLSQVVHSAVDFAMILPGVYVPAALLMGAALGGSTESLRVIEKLKGRKGKGDEVAKDTVTSERRSSWLVTIPSLVAALGCMLLLNHCRQAAIPLAVAESLDQEFQREDKLSIEDRTDSRVEKLIERAAQSGVTIDDSSCMMRLAAKSICFDDRREQWKSRTPESDIRLAWTETAPFIIRLAYDRVDDTNREAWLRSIGGEARLASIRKAHSLYAKARAQSPLDWQSLWGSIHTSLDCSTAELAVFAPVVQRTSGHLPQLLTSASILFNDSLSDEDRIRLWKSTLQSSPNASIDIGRLMSSQFEDDAVPVEIFPDNANILYSLAREVFIKKAFPKTHAVLCRRATDSVASQSNRPPSANAILLADIASEAGDPDSEIKHLALYLQYKPEDAITRIRQINLQIRTGKWEDADQSLRKLKQSDRKHPAIPELSKKINSRRSSG